MASGDIETKLEKQKNNESNEINGRFCKNCYTLLQQICTADVFVFRCEQCHNEVKPKPEDTLVYESGTKNDLAIYGPLLFKATEDNLNPKVTDKKCKRCGHNVITEVVLQINMSKMNICDKCRLSWSEASD